MKIERNRLDAIDYVARTNPKIQNIYLIVGFVVVSAITCSICTYSYLRVIELERTVAKQQESIVKVLQLYDLLQNVNGDQENAENEYEEYSDSYEYIEEDPLSEIKSSRNVRKRRNVLAETIDGIKINSESYATIKALNKSQNQRISSITPASVPITQPGFHSPAWFASPKIDAKLKLYQDFKDEIQLTTPKSSTFNHLATTKSSMQTRRSRVMNVEDKSKAFKQTVRVPKLKALDKNRLQDSQSAESGSAQYHKLSMANKHRSRSRQRLMETMDESTMTILKPTRKYALAAQYSGDTSKYVLGHHTNYNGNGHMKHPDKKYVDWASNEWMRSMNMDESFYLENGVMTIPESGLYFIYSQIYYLDEHDMNGYRVYKNSEAILQCTTMTHSTTRVIKGNTCFTAGIEYLNEGDNISIRDLSNERYSLFEKGKSFFGTMKISDARVK